MIALQKKGKLTWFHRLVRGDDFARRESLLSDARFFTQKALLEGWMKFCWNGGTLACQSSGMSAWQHATSPPLPSVKLRCFSLFTVFDLTSTCGFNYHTDMSTWYSFSHLFLGNRDNYFISQNVRIFYKLFSRSPSAHHLTPCSFRCHQKRQITR